MAVLKCKMCGGDLMLTEGSTIATCEYCGTQQTVPVADNEKKMTLFQRANRLRFACEFDKAAGIYESIVAEFPEEAEAYWGLILCKYGIEYVDDPITAKKIPTCHRSSFDSIMDDSDFEQVMENSDPASRVVYREEAKKIEELRKSIIEVSSKEEPYDIFICYKETAPDGDRTLDSVIAQDVYDVLTEKGYRVFFSRIALEDKLGQEYEPYIFAALNSAKVMLAFGTDYEYYNAVWVKNEWSRFLQLIAKGEKKTLIPCYKNIDAYDMPKEFAKLQAQDMGKVGAIQDLLRGIEKILPRQTDAQKETVKETVVVQQSPANITIDSLLNRMFLFLEDGKWESANGHCEKILDINPKCAEAYLGKLMANLQVRSKEELMYQKQAFDTNEYYRNTIRFADSALKNELKEYIDYINTRNAESLYNQLSQNMKNAKTYTEFQNLANQFETIKWFKDSAELFKQCTYNYALACMNSAEDSKTLFHIVNTLAQISPYNNSEELHRICYAKAVEAQSKELFSEAQKHMQGNELRNWEKALSLLEQIPDKQQYAQYIDSCKKSINTIKAYHIYLEKYPILKERETIEREYNNALNSYNSEKKNTNWTAFYAAIMYLIGIPLIIFGVLKINTGFLFLFIGFFSIMAGLVLVISALVITLPLISKHKAKIPMRVAERKQALDRVPAFRAEDYI